MGKEKEVEGTDGDTRKEKGIRMAKDGGKGEVGMKREGVEKEIRQGGRKGSAERGREG